MATASAPLRDIFTMIDGRTEKATVVLAKETATRIPCTENCLTFAISRLKPTKRNLGATQFQSISKAVKNIVLAYQIEEAIKRRDASNHAEVARQLGVSRARVSQLIRVIQRPSKALDDLLIEINTATEQDHHHVCP